MRVGIAWIAFTATLAWGAAGLSLLQAVPDSEKTQMTTVLPFVEAVDFPPLIRRLLPGSTAVRRIVTATGVSYLISRPGNRGPQSFPAQIGAFRDAKLAAEALQIKAEFMMIGATRSPEQIGDELRIFRSSAPDGGSLLFRRMNVFILLGPGIAVDERMVLARNIDAALRMDSPEIRHVSNLQTPEILAIQLPPTIHRREVAQGRIEISGANLSSVTLGSDSGAVSVQMLPVPIIIYTAPSEPMTHEFDIVLATAGNFISTKKIKIVVQ